MRASESFVAFILVFLCGFVPLIAQDEINNIPMERLIKRQVETYPRLEIQDIYKFLHQAAMGSEHAVKDTSAARKWMEDEISNLDWQHEDALIDTLSPDGNIVRVNLRSYLNAGYDPEKLLTAFINTANEYRGSREILEAYLNVVIEMIDKGELNFSKEEAQKFFDEQKSKGYPAVHHSKQYEELYSPAYRVVAKKFLSFLK